MADAKIIKSKLRRLLEKADMETATVRSLQKILEKQLGKPLDEYKVPARRRPPAALAARLPSAARSSQRAAEPPPPRARRS